MAPKASAAASSTARRSGKRVTSTKPDGISARSAPSPQPAPQQYQLTPGREAELLQEAESLGDGILTFPGKLARRVVWSSRIQLAAERDAADLIRTPFPDDEPSLTRHEIHAFRDRIELLRIMQSRWQATQQSQENAAANFEKPAAEASGHRTTLLRFFDVRFRKNPEGQKRISQIRAGSGDPDLIQDVSDLLLLCSEHAEAVAQGPRGEAAAVARLKELSPLLSRLLADKTLSPEAQRSRKLRDAAYTLVMHTERRLRAAAEYWYAGTDKLKDYAPFPVSTASGSSDEPEAAEPATDSGAPASPSMPA